jgi:DUF218 domain
MHLIVGLAGGLTGDGVLPEHAISRVKRCVELATGAEKAVILFSSSFTLNKPPILDNNGLILSEASAMAAAAKEDFEGEILCEQQSHDTIGSAYFVFRNFVEWLNPRKIHVVTSAFHVARSRKIFCHIGSLFGYDAENMIFDTSDEIIFPERMISEARSAEFYENNWENISSLQDFSRKLFLDHTNYNTAFSSGYHTPHELQSY